MDRKVAVEIHWVPGYMGIEENEKTGKAAKEAVERPGSGEARHTKMPRKV